MKELVDFLERYRPGHAAAVGGASPAHIARLEALAGVTLPDEYLEFLRSMGEDPGFFQVPAHDFRIGRILDLYELGEDLPPPGYLFVGAHEADAYADYYLDTKAPGGPVLRTDHPPLLISLRPEYPSFKETVFSLAFAFPRMGLLAHRRGLAPAWRKQADGSMAVPADAVARLLAAAAALGFQRLPQTSDLNPMLERGDAALIAHQAPQGRGVAIELAAQDDREIKRLAEVLQDTAGLV